VIAGHVVRLRTGLAEGEAHERSPSIVSGEREVFVRGISPLGKQQFDVFGRQAGDQALVGTDDRFG
jgi:hypothetical protein